MEQRRFFLFLTLSMSILIGWSAFGPKFFPELYPKRDRKPPPVAQNEQTDGTDSLVAASDPKPTAEQPAVPTNKDVADDLVAAVETAEDPGPETTPAQPELTKHPSKSIVLGSLDGQSAYYLQATLTTQGAAIAQIALNDSRYTEVDNRAAPLKLVKVSVDDEGTTLRTLQTSIPAIDEQLQQFQTSLNDTDWEVIETSSDPRNRNITTSAAFRRLSPDGKLEVVKRYALKRVDQEKVATLKIRDTDPRGYELGFELTVINRGRQSAAIQYHMQGPVGLPLENADNARKLRDIKIGMVDGETVDVETMTADEIAKAVADGGVKEQWQQENNDGTGTRRAFKFLGIDVQYFTALLFPEEDQLKEQYIESVKPQLVASHGKTAQSDISLHITSREFLLPPSGKISHHYLLYAGPKRRMLLEPLGAVESIDFYAIPGLGWVSKPISHGMLWIMNMFHSWSIPYGYAIILLTILVRGCMYPISRKQAAGAKKMKELQPKITEIKKKYGNDKEKLAKAQMELFRTANYNPLSGCLPLFLQLPIFIGLYQALYNAVDLRMAPFLWINNLAAPDKLVKDIGFSLPFLGSAFNLLPLITVCLWIVQQKMFMPPATDDQTALQQKMMTYMMVFFGFMFYGMPAGLCVYFITSTLWGMAERKLLDYGKQSEPKTTDVDMLVKKKDDKAQPAKDNLWGRLSAKITAAAEMQQQAVRDRNGKDKSSRSSRKKKKQSRSR